MKLTALTRRGALLLSLAALAGCAFKAPRVADSAPQRPPIVFVHGNGDTAALWLTTIWRFESNGWPKDRLHAVDMPYPLARDADDKPQPGRTSTEEASAFLAAEIDAVLQRTGAKQVVLIGNSRGGLVMRNYIAGGGAAKVSHAILGGTPNHGVWASPTFRPTNEFNGAGPFLTRLNNQGGPGIELTPGPKWMTIRSDANDKFAQPDGVWIGAKGTPTNVTAAGPELKGAENVVIPGIDHRETSYGPLAFAAMWRFLTGSAPASARVQSEARVVLDGKVNGLGLDNKPGTGDFANNLPLAGATVEVYATDAATGARLGPALHRKSVGTDGRWGPLVTTSKTALEFVVSAAGFATTHVYRSPFARSSDIVHLRAERIASADRDAPAVVTLTRPRGYFGIPRDEIELDGRSPPAGIPAGVAGVSVAKARLAEAGERAVAASFNGERIVGRSWPTAGNHVVLLELHD
ncbi:MAG: alpha/beta fold hydrolase [Piscinibacter sp.]|uniref:alpha/beta fold hydrolase n=1 Tax=Piscinibacter sp. TaxID=1903157 RepID=UPI003D0D31D5